MFRLFYYIARACTRCVALQRERGVFVFTPGLLIFPTGQGCPIVFCTICFFDHNTRDAKCATVAIRALNGVNSRRSTFPPFFQRVKSEISLSRMAARLHTHFVQQQQKKLVITSSQRRTFRYGVWSLDSGLATSFSSCSCTTIARLSPTFATHISRPCRYTATAVVPDRESSTLRFRCNWIDRNRHGLHRIDRNRHALHRIEV